MYDIANSKQKGGWDMNQIGLVGRLTKDPVLKQIAENRIQATFTIAVNRNFRNYRGDIDADFLFCTAWGKLAEHIVKYCGKGSLIGVNGRLQSRSYTREDQAKIFMTEVVVEEVRFYVLKPREDSKEKITASVLQAANSGASQVAETQGIADVEGMPLESQQHNSHFSSEFVLPREEPNLPVT